VSAYVRTYRGRDQAVMMLTMRTMHACMTVGCDWGSPHRLSARWTIFQFLHGFETCMRLFAVLPFYFILFFCSKQVDSSIYMHRSIGTSSWCNRHSLRITVRIARICLSFSCLVDRGSIPYGSDRRPPSLPLSLSPIVRTNEFIPCSPYSQLPNRKQKVSCGEPNRDGHWHCYTTLGWEPCRAHGQRFHFSLSLSLSLFSSYIFLYGISYRSSTSYHLSTYSLSWKFFKDRLSN
jgi:hypothetical protein